MVYNSIEVLINLRKQNNYGLVNNVGNNAQIVKTKKKKTGDNKGAIELLVLKVLWRNSDKDHPLSQQEIIDEIRNECGMEFDKRTICNAIEKVNLYDIGVKIEKKYMPGDRNKKVYFIDERIFNKNEIEVLTDSILCSQYLSEQLSKTIIQKLQKFTNEHFINRATSINAIRSAYKIHNDDVLSNIEKIDEAIQRDKRLEFDFYRYEYDPRLKRAIFKKSGHNIVSPYKTIVKNQKYYLICFNHDKDPKKNNLRAIRIDHMKNMKNRQEYLMKEGCSIETFDVMPHLYMGSIRPIEIKVDKWIVDDCIYWFGTKNIKFIGEEDGRVKFQIKTVPESVLYWALSYLDNAEVVSPADLRNKIKKTAEEGLKKYD